jgi:FkbM family methyltransferase
MKSIIKRNLKNIFSFLRDKFKVRSYTEILPKNNQTPESEIFNLASTSRALFRACYRNLRITNIIDVGASNGSWSAECMKYFPQAKYNLIEANGYHEKSLLSFSGEHPNVNFVIAAAGSKCGDCYFDNSDPFGGVAADMPHGGIKLKTQMICVDSLFVKKKDSDTFLLKLDTHGFEQSILKGAEETLKQTELVIIESYLFNLKTSESVTFDELCLIMGKYGFRVGDFSEPMWRVGDMALWQWDLFFFKKDNPMFICNSYIMA